MVSVAAMLSSEHVFMAGQGPGDAEQQQQAGGDGPGRQRGEHPAAAAARERLKALAAEGLGDHVLLLRLWETWQASGCSKECANQYGLDLRGMNFARDIRRQLEGARCAPWRVWACVGCGAGVCGRLVHVCKVTGQCAEFSIPFGFGGQPGGPLGA